VEVRKEKQLITTVARGDVKGAGKKEVRANEEGSIGGEGKGGIREEGKRS